MDNRGSRDKGGGENKSGIDGGFDGGGFNVLSFDLGDVGLGLANNISGSGELSLTSGTFTGDSDLEQLAIMSKVSLFFSKTEDNRLEPPREGTGTVGMSCGSNV